MNRILDAVNDIAALKTKEERRAALDRLPEDIRETVKQEVTWQFQLAQSWCRMLDRGYPWENLPEGAKETLYHMGYYKRPKPRSF